MAAPLKTPISVLNELAIRYDVHVVGQYIEDPLRPSVIDSTGRNTPLFWYEYRIGHYYVQEKGTSKKRAQHRAAERIIKMMKESPEYGSVFGDNITLTSPSEIKVDKDAIGPLTDFCNEYSLPIPEFCPVREEGPPHDRRFTNRCFTPSHAVEATDRQKKQAKQLVALKMLTTLKSTIEPRTNSEIEMTVEDTLSHDWRETVKKFPHCSGSFNTKYHPQDLSSHLVFDFSRFQSHHYRLKEVVDEFSPLETECPEAALDSILHKLDIDYSIIPVASGRSEHCFVAVNILFGPDLNVSEMGSSFVEASTKAARKALNYMRILCSRPPVKAEETSPPADASSESDGLLPELSVHEDADVSHITHEHYSYDDLI